MSQDPALPPSSEGRRSTLPQPAHRRLARLIDDGFVGRAPPTLQLLGRVLLHAAVVGAAVGFVSLIFVESLEVTTHFVLERLAGYRPLRAAGEGDLGPMHSPFRPWLLWALPAIGALIGGAISMLAPETRGGGADAIIDAFHNKGGTVRRRVPIVKMLASIATLGFGGSGGREGPTMQIGWLDRLGGSAGICA